MKQAQAVKRLIRDCCIGIFAGPFIYLGIVAIIAAYVELGWLLVPILIWVIAGILIWRIKT